MLWVWSPVLTVFPASCHLKKKEVRECVCVCVCVRVCVCVCARRRVSFSLVCGGDRRSPVPVACLSTPESAWVPGVPLHFLGSGMILFNYLFGLTLVFLGHYICFLFSLNYISNIYTQWRKLGKYGIQEKITLTPKPPCRNDSHLLMYPARHLVLQNWDDTYLSLYCFPLPRLWHAVS